MVLQSILQYRAFTDSEHVKQYANNHHEKIASPVTSRQPQKASTGGDREDGGDSPVSESLTATSTHERQPTEKSTADKASPPMLSSGVEEDPFLVKWDEGEQANPLNWSWTKKWLLIIMVTSIALLVGAGASIDSAVIEEAAVYFNVSTEVMGLQVGVFLIGFGISAPFLGGESHSL